MSKLAEVFTGKKEEVPQEIPPPPITKEEPSLSDEDTEKASKEPEEPKPVHEEEKESITSSVTTQSTATSQPSLQPQATVVHEVEKEAITRAEGATPIVQKEQEPKGFFEKVAQSIVSKKISRQKFDDLFWELEMTLLENNIAVEVIDKIKDDLALELVDKPLPRNKIESTIMETLERSIREVLLEPDEDVMAKIGTKKPFIICFIGINGSGKTTSIAKFAHMLQKQGKSVVLAAADTFRAAAIDQLELHANKLGVKIIKQDYGTDAAAVAFDAIKHAEAKGKDVVLIDTAGRLHSNKNLLAELQKLIRVAKPDMKIFVGESITGNDCVEQAKEFNEAVGIDAIILSKTDIDEKGGAAVSVSYVTKKPIIYIGTGQEYDDLEPFDKNTILKGLGME
ncbi:signal recognition particle-docking protein FtsY [Candidatus Woesearchaeota archaeon]|nr:signal recognition particle-docking protein FtsY [Candidatus Woesearchaeota archaeon]